MLAPFRHRNNLLVLSVFATIYYSFQVFILNSSLIWETLVGTHAISYKFSLLGGLMVAHLVMFPVLQVTFLIGSAALVGTNLMLLVLRIQKARSYGGLKTNIGGVGVLAIVSSGCPSCSIGIFTVLGTASGAASLLLRSWVVQFGIIGILSVGIILSLQSLRNNQCRILAMREK